MSSAVSSLFSKHQSAVNKLLPMKLPKVMQPTSALMNKKKSKDGGSGVTANSLFDPAGDVLKLGG
jgi:hypothetical protein